MAFDGSTWPGRGGNAPVKTPGKPVWSPPKVVIPPSKPKYFGPARTPKRVPFGKKKKPVPVPMPQPFRINPLDILLGSGFGVGLGFFWPGQQGDPFSWAPTNPAFVACGVSCTPLGDPYLQGPIWGQNRNSSGTGCGPAACGLSNQGCPTGSTQYSGTGNLGRTLTNRPLNCVSMHEARPVMSGGVQVDVRCHVLQVWCAPDGAVGAPSYDPQGALIDPGRPPFIPHTMPDPFAEQKPGMGQPFPKPIPYRVLPKVPDLDYDILPGPAPLQPAPVPVFPIVEPFPGVIPPLPWPTPLPTPTPDPGTVPVWPWPDPPQVWPGLPNPNPAPPPPTQPIVLPPYFIPAVAWMLDVKLDAVEFKPAWQYHRLTTPGPREKEKKFRMSAPMAVLWAATGAATEMLDMIDILYGAIPCQVKYDQGMMIRGRKVGPHMKAAFVAANMKHLDGREVVRLGTKNAFEDRFYGTLSPEKAQYRGSYEAGINTHGGKSIESNQRYRPQTGERNPVIDAFNAGVDQLLGPRPKEFSCCGGRKNTCAKVQFGKNAKVARAIGAVFGRKAQQNFWVAAKQSTRYKRNAYSQARAGYRWQPGRSGRLVAERS